MIIYNFQKVLILDEQQRQRFTYVNEDQNKNVNFFFFYVVFSLIYKLSQSIDLIHIDIVLNNEN